MFVIFVMCWIFLTLQNIFDEDQPKKCILVVLPRKISVITAAVRVSEELNTKIGDLVGYSLKFDSKLSNETQIKFITYSSFLKEVQIDPCLSCYSVIMFDDAHESSLDFELSLFLAKRILNERNLSDYPASLHLKLILSSSTLDVERLSRYFRDELNLKSEVIPGYQSRETNGNGFGDS